MLRHTDLDNIYQMTEDSRRLRFSTLEVTQLIFHWVSQQNWHPTQQAANFPFRTWPRPGRIWMRLLPTMRTLGWNRWGEMGTVMRLWCGLSTTSQKTSSYSCFSQKSASHCCHMPGTYWLASSKIERHFLQALDLQLILFKISDMNVKQETVRRFAEPMRSRSLAKIVTQMSCLPPSMEENSDFCNIVIYYFQEHNYLK